MLCFLIINFPLCKIRGTFNLVSDAVETEEKLNESETNIPVDDDDDFLDENVVDLRSFSPMGAIAFIELLELPPQQHKVNNWYMQQSKAQ